MDISGIALEDIEGHGVENVSVQLLDAETMAVIEEDHDRRLWLLLHSERRSGNPRVITFSKEGYLTVNRTFLPDNVGLDPVTMNRAVATPNLKTTIRRCRDGRSTTPSASSTAVGLLTFLTALLGVQSAVEIRRGKRYRRSQYLAAGALFSRGLIIVGPTLILFGMIVNLFAKED